MKLHELVVEAARRDPGAVAVTGPDDNLSYEELNADANWFARSLSRLGVSKGDRVVIWSDKSTRAVTAMQAVLRLGAVYVPVDGSNPLPRALKIATDCDATVVATTAERAAELRDAAPGRFECVEIDEPYFGAAASGDEPAPVSVPVDDDDMAYILYTSGSTGDPKGVCISHRNAMAFVEWAAEEIQASSDDCFANHAPFNFDLSVLDLYVAFLAGASVHLIPSQLAYSPTALVDVLRNGITVWYSVPSALVLMMREGGLLEMEPPEKLRVLLFAGEPFPTTHLGKLRAHWSGIRFLNLYGPTETNVCTYHEVHEDFDATRPVPIGRACSGDRVWARKDDGSVAGQGEEGELFVEGPTVMLGYWGRPRHEGAYATGDIVRVIEDGVFDYVGRRDHMVKVRGHRVELGEVESALLAHPDVAEVAVVATGAGMSSRLEAFVVPANGHAPSLLSAKRHCAERLPRYMIVDAVHTLDALPRTQNGKTDRRRLTELADRSETLTG